MPHSTSPQPSPEVLDSQSPLLRLPREIRDRIYAYALTREQAFLWPTEDLSYKLSPALLATCHQIHDEATPMLYKLNRFSFKHPSDCNVFCHIMSRQHIKQVPKVGFHIREKDINLFLHYFKSVDPVRSLTYDLPNLQHLIVFLTQTWQTSRDPEEAIVNWSQSSVLKNICMALETKTKAEVTVLCTVRISELTFQQLRHGQHSDILMMVGPGQLRTRPVEVHRARVLMELICSHSGSHAATR